MATKLPGDQGAWDDKVKIEKAENKTIHNIPLTSASTISDEQYLMLRVLWKEHQFDKLDVVKFGLGEWNSQAVEMLKTYSSWTQYCNSFSSDVENEGIFALAQFYQKQVALIPDDLPFRSNLIISSVAHHIRSRMRGLVSGIQKLSFETPTKPPSTPPNPPSTLGRGSEEELDDSTFEETPPGQRSYGPKELLDLSYPRTKDEQIVNTALVDLLNAFIIPYKLPVYWTLHRKQFIATFENGHFEARTDGCLEDRRSETYAIVEVKPMLRERESIRIQMQESAEMVAWIKSDPDPDGFLSSCGLRVLVSQDRHEIFLTFADYGFDYVKYLNNTLGPDEKPGFLTMHQFGPWDTTRGGDMKQLGSILLALALRARANHVNNSGVQASASSSSVVSGGLEVEAVRRLSAS
ncbi:hypothetical protein BO94DRAFT_624752 [Aspergillus sclerotioniger CBS 115572]|uniref:Uncharacterized protein n=1 Tax=Aspergillus sclerotioniger CBS 115572 TaxID=1450535 RepID=A0A317WMS0_9EURO|nr:hypothetical protein BO94DRAFT_624752 [Aspergillus sclerotioniger CBS 115572]PWY86572.1 hypothetical protein BO94DRAFT_624752 [Aspergillus sclerotioniger CBS 115572]